MIDRSETVGVGVAVVAGDALTVQAAPSLVKLIYQAYGNCLGRPGDSAPVLNYADAAERLALAVDASSWDLHPKRRFPQSRPHEAAIDTALAAFRAARSAVTNG